MSFNFFFNFFNSGKHVQVYLDIVALKKMWLFNI